jgi:hypothetical protein
MDAGAVVAIALLLGFALVAKFGLIIVVLMRADDKQAKRQQQK